MKKLIKLIFILGIIMLIISTGAAVFAKDTSGSIDLVFSVGSKNYYSKGVRASLKAAPFIKDDILMAPVTELLKGLGYEVVWNAEDSTINAMRDGNTMKFQLDNSIVIINGESRNMPQPLMIAKKEMFVPVRFMGLSVGAGVSWEQKRKRITITKIGNFNTGEVVLLEKAKDGNNVLIYDGYKMKKISINSREVSKTYYFKDKVLLGIGEKGKNPTSLAVCGDDNYSMLLDDFDINGTFEFNNNLMIYGYDKKQMKNKMYRFDGSNLNLVADNFDLEKYILFGDKLVISQYDNARIYSLVVFDKNSWNPFVISRGFVLKESVELDGYLYMTGAYQEGKKRPLAVYDGRTTSPSSFSVLNDDLKVDLENAAVFGGKLYVITDNTIKIIERFNINNLLFPFNGTVYLKYNANSVKLYNGKLYFGVTGTKFVDILGETVSKPDGISTIPPTLLEFTNQWSTRRIIDKFSTSELMIQNGKLLILGKEKDDGDSVMYIFDGVKTARAIDVYSINNTFSINNSILTDVKDKDRSTNKLKNTILLYENANITNVISGLVVKQWDIIGNTLIIAGKDNTDRTYKLFSYNSNLEELEENYKTKYWSKFQSVLFVNGYDVENKTYSVLRFVDENKEDLDKNIEILKMTKVKDNNYLVYAKIKEKGDPLYGKKVLYFYNDSTREFTEMKVKINLDDMLYLQ